MPVIYNKDLLQFQLNTKNSSYVIKIIEGLPVHLYWGEPLDDADHSYMFWEMPRAAFSCREENCGGYIVDDIRNEYPCWGRGDNRSPAVEVINKAGYNIADFRYTDFEIIKGAVKPDGLPGMYEDNPADNAQTLVLYLTDKVLNAKLALYYTVFENYDIIARFAKITNMSNEAFKLNRMLSASVDFDSIKYDVISNYGTHCYERNIQRAPLARGTFEISSRRGASSHVHNPFFILADKNTNEDAGEAFGFVLVYSGSFAAKVEGTQFEACRAQIGLNPDGFGWTVNPGEDFQTPQAVLCRSNEGLTKLSHNFADAFANNLCRGKFKNKRRPVLLNMWEGCTFNFDEKRVLDIAKASADAGIELLVIDDGWFGKRDNDRCSLGDWTYNKKKLPEGLKNISAYVKSRNMGLGIWFEPEMISPDSELYKAHPDWALSVPGRPRSEGRYQLMIDMSREDVTDYLYDSIAAVLKTGTVDYVKWDFNRNMAEVGSALLPAEQQCELPHRYYLGLYKLLERLVTDFPDVLFESCSGGGGRFDAGMLYYMPQTWTSDNSDAISRIRIQYGTSLVYPMSAVSAHVSVSPNMQTGHVTSFKTRFTGAFTGSFGYELDPTKIPKEELDAIKQTAQVYKKYGFAAATGDYYRLKNTYEGDDSAYCFVSKDKSVCVFGYILKEVSIYGPCRRVKLKGLEKGATYREVFSGKEYTAAQLEGFGVDIHIAGEFQSEFRIFERI